MTSQLRTTVPRDCHCSAQLRPPLKGLPSRATACRYVYTGPGGVSSLATDPPGPRWPPARLEVLHLFRWYTHIYIYVYIYISYITYHISYIYLSVLSCHSPILSYLKAMDLGTLFFFQNLGRDSKAYKLENICQCYMKFASVAPPSCNICSSRHFSGQVLKGGDLTTVPLHQIDPNWIFSEFQKRTNK